jgi:hypothetical protein
MFGHLFGRALTIIQILMSMRWERSGRLKVEYMAWSKFKALVFESSGDASHELNYDYIWGGADFLLDVR